VELGPLPYRVLLPEEQWGPPWFHFAMGQSIRTRVRCQGAPGQHGACVAGATVAVGRRLLCRTHLRIMARQGGYSGTEEL
jgi:hypothetical protein